MGLNDDISAAVNWDAPRIAMEDSLRVVIQKMVDSRTSALLVKVGAEVAGIVTDMDVMKAVVDENDLDKTKASNLMTACELISGNVVKSPCVQLHEAESVKNALGVLDTAGVHNLVVSGENDKLTGIVSIRDLLKLVIS